MGAQYRLAAISGVLATTLAMPTRSARQGCARQVRYIADVCLSPGAGRGRLRTNVRNPVQGGPDAYEQEGRIARCEATKQPARFKVGQERRWKRPGTDEAQVESGEEEIALHFSPYPGAGADWPGCSSCGAVPVKISVRRDGAFRDALLCADCEARVRAGDEQVVSRIPER